MDRENRMAISGKGLVEWQVGCARVRKSGGAHDTRAGGSARYSRGGERSVEHLSSESDVLRCTCSRRVSFVAPSALLVRGLARTSASNYRDSLMKPSRYVSRGPISFEVCVVRLCNRVLRFLGEGTSRSVNARAAWGRVLWFGGRALWTGR